MGKLDCDKSVCFYNSSTKCTNIAVSMASKCGLFLDVNNKKQWQPKVLARPDMDEQASAANNLKKAGANA